MNGLTPPKAGVTDWPPGAQTRAARGAPEPSERFAGILQSTARTAPAEGQDRSPRTTGRERHDDSSVANDRRRSRAESRREDKPERPDAREPKAAPATEPKPEAATKPAVTADQPVADGDQTAQQKAAVDAAALVALVPAATPQAEATPVVTTTPAQQQSEQAQQAQQQPVATAPVVAQAAVTADAAAQANQPAQPVQAAQPAQAGQQVATDTQPQQSAAAKPEVPTETVAADAAPADVAATEPVAKAAAKQPVDGQRPAGPVQASDTPASAQKPSGDAGNAAGNGNNGNGNGNPNQGQPGTLPQPAVDQARAAAQAYGRTARQAPVEAPAAQPASAPTVSGTAPAAAQATGTDLPEATPVPLARAAETVEHVLRLAANRGITHARVVLRPAELGSIDIHLRQTADGLAAKVIAHTPEAVQQLQHAAADLRRSLEQQGLNLLNLDIGQSGDERAAGGAGAGFGDGSGAGAGNGSDGDVASGDAEVTTKSTLQLPNGVLVDVLA